jgi:hypothetical protein
MSHHVGAYEGFGGLSSPLSLISMLMMEAVDSSEMLAAIYNTTCITA